MLFIIDMQNNFVDPKKGTMYVKEAETIVPGIIKKIQEYKEKKDQIFYTLDIHFDPQEGFSGKNKEKIENNNDKENIALVEKKTPPELKWGLRVFDKLKEHLLDHEKVKKSYYALPPETLLQIQERFKGDKSVIGKIELVGVETHICVLANAICLQSAFPEAKIIIDASLCRSNNRKGHEKALNLMEGLGMEIRK